MLIKSLFNIYVNRVVKSYYPIPLFNKFKSFLLQRLGAKLDCNIFIHQNVFISSPHKLKIGKNCVISRGVTIIASGGVIIGDNVLIGYDSKILTKNHIIPDNIEEPVRFSGHIEKPIIIEDDVWIASNVVILPGVTVKTGSVIAANSLVNRDVDEYSIYGGTPARLIKKR